MSFAFTANHPCKVNTRKISNRTLLKPIGHCHPSKFAKAKMTKANFLLGKNAFQVCRSLSIVLIVKCFVSNLQNKQFFSLILAIFHKMVWR
jgi:hypothetical protein